MASGVVVSMLADASPPTQQQHWPPHPAAKQAHMLGHPDRRAPVGGRGVWGSERVIKGDEAWWVTLRGI